MVACVPLNVGLLTVPSVVPVTETLPDVPENVPFSSAPVPVNSELTEPVVVPLTETLFDVPVKDAEDGTLMFPVTSLAPVPVKVGVLAV